jgi:hypothetical protein
MLRQRPDHPRPDLGPPQRRAASGRHRSPDRSGRAPRRPGMRLRHQTTSPTRPHQNSPCWPTPRGFTADSRTAIIRPTSTPCYTPRHPRQPLPHRRPRHHKPCQDADVGHGHTPSPGDARGNDRGTCPGLMRRALPRGQPAGLPFSTDPAEAQRVQSHPEH